MSDERLLNLQKLQDALENRIRSKIQAAFESDSLIDQLKVYQELSEYTSYVSAKKIEDNLRLSPPATIQRITYAKGDEVSFSQRRSSCDRHHESKKKCDPDKCYENLRNKCLDHRKGDKPCTRKCSLNKLVLERQTDR